MICIKLNNLKIIKSLNIKMIYQSHENTTVLNLACQNFVA